MGVKHSVDDISPGPLKLQFVDSNGNPIDALDLKLKLDDGSTVEKTTDSSGNISLDGVKGNIEITVPSSSDEESGGGDQDSSSSGNGNDSAAGDDDGDNDSNDSDSNDDSDTNDGDSSDSDN